ncbi:MAG TPA: NAD(P)H-dependent glycerol-3-phosphate dehydrogenase [Pseudonocardia sp.]|nr:NAD(P)H-dependent glycerol-3-phosphate dehydrogenase [Pseudonocardia sp.]
MADVGPVAVLGAGAMGTALALHLARSGADVALLATDHDGPVVEAWRRRAPHPALLLPFHDVACHPPQRWPDVLPRARLVVVAVSSGGLATVLAGAREQADPEVWVLATKGWEPESLCTPSEVAAEVLGDAPVVSLAGPGIAAEIAGGAPTGLLCVARDRAIRRLAAHALTGPMLMVFTSPDLPGAETASAFKNVVAVAVGLAEGLAERVSRSGVTRGYGNARGAVFARGMLDMQRLVEARGGRSSTVLGLAGAGDLYVTCQHGRNGRFGRLLGQGLTVEGAVGAIGSTVEGVANTAAAIRLADRCGIDLPSARIVEEALRQKLTDDKAVERLREVFLTALSIDGAVPLTLT